MDRVENKKSLLVASLVWIFRILVGATFLVSGWSKSIDPWGFIYKIEEYFSVWGLVLPREITLAFAMLLSVSEFVAGMLVATGAMRRVSVWLAAAFMCFMLPLTAYIAVADPVSDCGCFGDFIVLSNYATLGKNIVLSAMIIYLLTCNDRVAGIFTLSVQWLVVAGAIAYSTALAFIGYRYQPLVDFRPYPVGSVLSASVDLSDIGEDSYIYPNTEDSYIYTKDGVEKSFGIDDLPDSTWTFVSAEIADVSEPAETLTVYDEDGFNVTDEVLDGVGDMLILVVSDPGIRYLTKSRLANELYEHLTVNDSGRMVAFVAAEGDALQSWRQLALPEYPVYSVEDTSLKELVRGDAALVWLHDGTISWKRNLASVRFDALRSNRSDGGKLIGSEDYSDGSTFHLWLTLSFIAWLILVYVLKFPDKILFRLIRHSAKNS